MVMSFLNSIWSGISLLSPGSNVGGDAGAVLQTVAPVLNDAVNTASEEGGGIFSQWWIYVFYIAVIAAMYFFMFRPQRKREKEMKNLQSSLRVGDNIVTSSGMYGKIMDVGQDCFVVEFGTNRGVRIPIRKADVIGVKEPVLTQTSGETVS